MAKAQVCYARTFFIGGQYINQTKTVFFIEA